LKIDMGEYPTVFYAKRKRMRLSFGVRQPYGNSRKSRKRRAWLWNQYLNRVVNSSAFRPTSILLDMVEGLPVQRTFYPDGRERIDLIHGFSAPVMCATGLVVIAPDLSPLNDLKRFISGPLAEPLKE
jgi:hypothetical protein